MQLAPTAPDTSETGRPFILVAEVCSLDDARAAAAAGATEVVLDPFLRHPLPPVSRVRALAEELGARGVGLRLRTQTILRPEERRTLDKWLEKPEKLIPGTKMVYFGMADPAKRQEVIAYLKTLK